jgi:hypothetical protein
MRPQHVLDTLSTQITDETGEPIDSAVIHRPYLISPDGSVVFLTFIRR